MAICNHSYFSISRAILARHLLVLVAVLPLFVTSFPGAGHAAPWGVVVDATREGFLPAHAFGPLEKGFTDVVPPSGIRQDYAATQTENGYEWRLMGTELSVWQVLEIPQAARYLLSWHFLYEGRILEGMGRTGFLFGNPAESNYLSVEMTYHGSLRLVRWGRMAGDNHGQIVWSRRMTKGGRGPVRIEADYDIRSGNLVCRVNDGEPVRIALEKHMTAPPLTLRGAGFFSAVPEAPRDHIANDRLRRRGHEIDLSRRFSRTAHTRFEASGK